MIGNDIVDLKQADQDSNWNRKGYLDKIFTEEEQFLISSNMNPSLIVWLLWSMKESAYKIHSRATKLRTFAPTKLRCNNLIIHDYTATGNVLHEDDVYVTSSVITSEYIHTIAALSAKDLELAEVRVSQHVDNNYRSSNPVSVSHHGRYLALAYI
mgnify:CR=1 FL=1